MVKFAVVTRNPNRESIHLTLKISGPNCSGMLSYDEILTMIAEKLKTQYPLTVIYLKSYAYIHIIH